MQNIYDINDSLYATHRASVPYQESPLLSQSCAGVMLPQVSENEFSLGFSREKEPLIDFKGVVKSVASLCERREAVRDHLILKLIMGR